jgi:hypothetical protein
MVSRFILFWNSNNDHDITERVIVPQCQILKVVVWRCPFVRFTDDDGSEKNVATYTFLIITTFPNLFLQTFIHLM